MLKTFEAIIDTKGTVHLREPLKLPISRKAIVTILEEDWQRPEELAWLQAASKNEVFDFLKDQEEDIYTDSDGKPFHDPS